jgi:predicted DNA-binding transcriptional regulator YafY
MASKTRQAVRCVKLLEMFHARGTLATKDVMEMFDIDRQAARRDVLALIEAGIPIDQIGGGNATRNVLDESYQRSRFVFSVGDAFALHMARNMMPFLENTVVTEWLDQLRDKLAFGKPERTRDNEATFSQRLVFLSEPHRSYEAHEAALDKVIRGLLEDRTLELQYAGRTNVGAVVVEPRALVVFRRALYLLARKPGTDRPRRFAIERIESAQLGEPFAYPAHFNPRAAFRTTYGISDPDQPLEEVRLRFHEVVADLVQTRKHHFTQRFEPAEDGKIDLVMRVTGRELVNLALEYGWTVEVISPPWLRAKVAEHHRRAAAQYADVPFPQEAEPIRGK